MAKPGTRRIYSNAGFDVLGDHLAAVTGIACADYLRQALCEPLGPGRDRAGRPAAPGRRVQRRRPRAGRGRAAAPRPAAAPEHRGRAGHRAVPRAVRGACPGSAGRPHNDWGLGFEIRDSKSPHWTGSGNAPTTYGHFGRSGTFLWVDPVARLGLVVLTDTEFEQWAKDAWPPLADAVLRAYRRQNAR